MTEAQALLQEMRLLSQSPNVVLSTYATVWARRLEAILPPVAEDCGLSIDMLDADRLRAWAELYPEHMSDMNALANGVARAVRDIGQLRKGRV